MSFEMMIAYAIISGSLGEIKVLEFFSFLSFIWDSSYISRSCVKILVIDSIFSLGSNYNLHLWGSLPYLVAITKNLSISSHIRIICFVFFSRSGSLDTSLIISRILFHRKSNIWRNSKRFYPGGKGKAKSFWTTLSASIIYYWISLIACMRPRVERGRSVSSSLY